MDFAEMKTKLLELNCKKLQLLEEDLLKLDNKTITEYINLVESTLEDVTSLSAELVEKNHLAAASLRDQLNDIHKSTLAGMLSDPCRTMESLIQYVERKRKIESQDGRQNASWRLEFGLMARLQMAWKLLIG